MVAMKVIFVRSHGPYKRGAIIDHQYPGAARELKRRGIIEFLEDEKPRSEKPKRDASRR